MTILLQKTLFLFPTNHTSLYRCLGQPFVCVRVRERERESSASSTSIFADAHCYDTSRKEKRKMQISLRLSNQTSHQLGSCYLYWLAIEGDEYDQVVRKQIELIDKPISSFSFLFFSFFKLMHISSPLLYSTAQIQWSFWNSICLCSWISLIATLVAQTAPQIIWLTTA